ncbi:MAG: alpha/beta hydrolase [Alphaproteobacteria bacterium]|nr:alpha/beta hydrolase [Alphaproteobacteria bacterium]
MQSFAYGPGPRHRLDLYEPRGKARGVVVYLYGGGWRSGRRGLYGFLARALAARGYRVIVPDYRIFPEVRFPAFVEDAAQAVAWVGSRADGAGEALPLFLIGHSAGAHIAALLALDARYLLDAGAAPQLLKGFVGIAGPMSFDPTEWDSTRPIFSGLPDPERARPVKLVRPGAPAMLLIHGNRDKTVGLHNSEHLLAAMRAAGNEANLITLSGVGHVMPLASFLWAAGWVNSAMRETVRFLDRLSAPAHSAYLTEQP